MLGGGVIEIGKNTFINDASKINSRKCITIGNGVLIGQNVLIYDHDHDYRSGCERMHGSFVEKEIVIGDNTWIGSGSIILKGSVIGKRCVIGAGTVVSGTIPDDTLVYDVRDKRTRKLEPIQPEDQQL